MTNCIADIVICLFLSLLFALFIEFPLTLNKDFFFKTSPTNQINLPACTSSDLNENLEMDKDNTKY